MIKGEKLKWLIARKGIAPEKFAEELGISVSSVFKYYNKDSFDSSLLEKFANYFGVPVGYFFDEEAPVNQNTANVKGDNNVLTSGHSHVTISKLSDCEKEVAHLKEIIAEKERLIQILLKDR